MRDALFTWLLLTIVAATAHAADREPLHFVLVDSDRLEARTSLVERPDVAGVQIVYSWKSLEPAPDEYDFSRIEHDLAFVERRGKRLFVQLQDRFFTVEARNVPAYLLTDPEYGGGLAPQTDHPGEDQPQGHGWVAMQWNDAVRARFQALLRALAQKLDGRIFGINLPESAVEIEEHGDRTGFTCDAYFAAEMENARVARALFSKSRVVQYVNFWPCEWNDDRHYMSRFFAFAKAARIGLGGPDIVPWRKAQMNNSYPFFHEYRGQLDLVALAVQEPTLTYSNPATRKKFTRAEFVDFARDYLGADVVFWSASAPWLRD